MPHLAFSPGRPVLSTQSRAARTPALPSSPRRCSVQAQRHPPVRFPRFLQFSRFFRNAWIGEPWGGGHCCGRGDIAARGSGPRGSAWGKARVGGLGGCHPFKASFKVHGISYPASTNFHSFGFSQASLVWSKAKHSQQIFFQSGVGVLMILESQNHRIIQVGKDL